MIAWGLVTFNRPAHTKRVIDVLREHRVEPLFVFVDGPRNSTDVNQISDVRKEIATIEWTRPIIYSHNENWGLKRSLVNAVNAMLASFNSMVLIEDDCVPGPWFFDFMQQCLSRYEKEERVMSVSGYTVPIPEALKMRYESDVYFHPRISSWGWGTWRRAWNFRQECLDAGMRIAHEQKIDLNRAGRDVPNLIDAQMRGTIDAWTPSWILGVLLRDGLCVYPTVSHVKNIGFDGTGVHCTKSTQYDSPIAVSPAIHFPAEPFTDEAFRRHLNSFYGG